MKNKPRITVSRLIERIVLVFLLLITVFPFFWMLRTAFVANANIFSDSMSLIPKEPTIVNFKRVLGLSTTEESLAAGGNGQQLDFFLYLGNSLLFTAVVVACQVTFSALAAYTFSRLRFRGRDALFTVFLSGMMIPPIFSMLPNFALVRSLGWIDSFAGILAPYLLITPFAIFFLRQFFLGISREVEEAARIDGAGRFQILTRIVLPMASGPLTTLAIIQAVGAWNEYMWPQLVGRDDSVKLLNVAVAAFAKSSPNSQPDWAGLMAAASLQVIPMLILLIIFGKKIVSSLGFSGVK
ncbi:MAG: carbohydrate ABC transporter permease [Propionibacteriaceae bacterium]|jgi:multiple sugar transport system permease protein|nr:carbohydrate ABC transporter permease [Propionibacteriaceae bacterium]